MCLIGAPNTLPRVEPHETVNLNPQSLPRQVVSRHVYPQFLRETQKNVRYKPKLLDRDFFENHTIAQGWLALHHTLWLKLAKMSSVTLPWRTACVSHTCMLTAFKTEFDGRGQPYMAHAFNRRRKRTSCAKWTAVCRRCTSWMADSLLVCLSAWPQQIQPLRKPRNVCKTANVFIEGYDNSAQKTIWLVEHFQ